MNRGEVWWLEHPRHGRRPACILTRGEAIPVLDRLLVAPATRTIRGIPTEVQIEAVDGMPSECVLALDDLRQASKALLTERITRLNAVQMEAVCRALSIATGCR